MEENGSLPERESGDLQISCDIRALSSVSCFSQGITAPVGLFPEAGGLCCKRDMLGHTLTGKRKNGAGERGSGANGEAGMRVPGGRRVRRAGIDDGQGPDAAAGVRRAGL